MGRGTEALSLDLGSISTGCVHNSEPKAMLRGLARGELWLKGKQVGRRRSDSASRLKL